MERKRASKNSHQDRVKEDPPERKNSKVHDKDKPHSVPVPKPWLMEDYNEEQLEKIKQFRTATGDELSPEENDLQLVRWLVARKWDVSDASKMYIESKKWRKTKKIDTITEWIQDLKSFKFLTDYWPISIIPEKKSPPLRTIDGYLVIYERLTEMHPDILDIVSLEDMIHFHIYIQELCAMQQRRIMAEEKNGTYAGIIYVYDLCSLTISHLSRSNYNMFQEFNTFDSNNYPETLRRVFLINAPSVFTMGWKVAKKFLDPATIKKIVILGTDFKEELFKAIPPESLPKAYGGTLDYLPSGGGSIKGIKKFT